MHPWTQIYEPIGGIFFSALIASIPLILLFYMLAIRRSTGHCAAIVSTSSAIVLWQMPVGLALNATAMGMCFGLFPIVWIIITAVWIYNMTVESGEFEKIKVSLATFTAGLITSVIMPQYNPLKAFHCLGRTIVQLRFPILTTAAILGLAYIMNYSGMSATIGLAFTHTGSLFPFFSPLLGWLGVFLTGSDASSNALFCSLQRTTAEAVGIDPLLTVAGNSSGGVVGKMISPQSIAVATAATGLIGSEGHLFRFTLKHSLIMIVMVGLLILAQAYLFNWMIPG